ncbi:MAG: symmetrical bis(5'-nucleosyl)-tetraphosphatase [Methylomonas sp.]|jgi:bis(5'-nucleosyl)-tetraphosphatase (symmetrical)
MTTYAIGSVKGCYESLRILLEKIRFDPENDSLWFTGNFIGAGPESLATLRFIKNLGKKAVTVLGNQELRLLRVAEGLIVPEANDKQTDILNAEDSEQLLKWLRQRPLIHHDAKLNFTLVHAGIPAEWSFSQALTFAYEVESVLASANYRQLLENPEPDQSRWHAKLRGWKRLRFIANACTLMKYCNRQGKLDFMSRGPAAAQTTGLVPWYRLPDRLSARLNIIFSDEANFQDAGFPGIYPMPAQADLSAVKLSASPGIIGIARVEQAF